MTDTERIAVIESALPEKADWSAFEKVDGKMDALTALVRDLREAFTTHVALDTMNAEYRAATCPRIVEINHIGANCDGLGGKLRTLEDTVVKHHDEMIRNHDKAIASLLRRDDTRKAWIKGAYVGAGAIIAFVFWLIGKTDLIAKFFATN